MRWTVVTGGGAAAIETRPSARKAALLNSSPPSPSGAAQEPRRAWGRRGWRSDRPEPAVIAPLERRAWDASRLAEPKGLKPGAAGFSLTQAVLPHFRARRAGVVVNVTSTVTMAPMPLVAVYTASKTAVEGFTASPALELAAFGVRVKLVGLRPDHELHPQSGSAGRE